MADVTIADPAQLTTPAADDKIPVWDTSASQQKWIRRDDLVGAIITGGKNLVAPADGTLALIDVAQVYTTRQTIPAVFSGNTGTLADDTAYSFTPGYSQGVLLIWTYSSGGISSQRAALVSFRAAGTPHAMILVQGGTAFEASTAALAGTTGTDAKVTVSAASDGKIYIENRSGVSMNHGFFIVGGI